MHRITLSLFPINIRYFNSSGVQNKLLDFVDLQDENQNMLQKRFYM